MATNPTTKKPAADTAAEETAEAVTETAPARPARKTAPAPDVVGPALPVGVDPVAVILAHHHTIDGTNYPPGAKLLVSPDYARRLRGQGYATPA
ncbi:hypothetical protein SAMN05216483_6745 [Streptomyces sp. 2131.1]|uniref:DUF7210 family protein n=1 Tax=Streptomyces sp. 2131.1 TaxID=1855346 RepID=UPI000898D3D0|nr:hypothetical protein [Streptomyces sp. 2131.1]SEE84207.1 hypothetical protein SAMN05216483_6745 [Streptomyces sp. 2131.1]